MSFANRLAIPAFLLVSAITAGPNIGFAQTVPPAGQPGEDQKAHHPGTGPDMPSTPPSNGMPMGMIGKDGQAGMMKQMMSMMRNMMTMMASHVEGRIASLKSELKITEAQTPQWNRFADALRATAKSMSGAHQKMMQPKGTGALPDRLEAREAILSAHLASLKVLKEALDPLYASFSDDQKKRADGLMIGPMGMM
jgi:hypothetical protein